MTFRVILIISNTDAIDLRGTPDLSCGELTRLVASSSSAIGRLFRVPRTDRRNVASESRTTGLKLRSEGARDLQPQ